MKYAFIERHRLLFSIRAMCRCLRVHLSGFHAWLKNPVSKRAIEDTRQTELIKEAWEESRKVYSYRKVHNDLCDQGETCCPNRVTRLARLADIKAWVGHNRRPGKYGRKPSVVLNIQFDVDAPDRFRVTNITYIKTYEGFLSLAVVIDQYSRRVVGWATQSRQLLTSFCRHYLWLAGGESQRTGCYSILTRAHNLPALNGYHF